MIVLIDFMKKYYQLYGPILIIMTVILTAIYWFFGNLPYIRATYDCVNLKNTITGNAVKCFNSNAGAGCDDTDIGYIYGWCNDGDNYGSLLGNHRGPYNGNCSQWVWDKKECPPGQCQGIQTQNQSQSSSPNEEQKWGWCADKGSHRAMEGTPCGPRGAQCENWIWDAKKCSTACTPAAISKEPACKRDSAGKCDLVCGLDEKGNKKQCPPANCGGENCPDRCQCTGPMKDPWKPYLDRPVRIRSSDKKYHLRVNHMRGRVHGVGSEEKAIKFTKNTKKGVQGSSLLIEKSNDGNYRIIDSNGCTMQWSGATGGKSLGKKERVAKFDCGGSAGDPLIIEGTPGHFKIYADAKGKKHGLQWSAVSGRNPGMDRHDFVAKFDPNGEADELAVDMI